MRLMGLSEVGIAVLGQSQYTDLVASMPNLSQRLPQRSNVPCQILTYP